jgi:hypothetical protein
MQGYFSVPMKSVFVRGEVHKWKRSWLGLDVEPLLHWLDLALYGVRPGQRWAQDGAHLTPWMAKCYKEVRKSSSSSHGRHNLSVHGCHNGMWHGRWKIQLLFKIEEQATEHSSFRKEERWDYRQTASRNICHIFHSAPRCNTELKREKRSSFRGVFVRSLCNLVIQLVKKFPATLGNARQLSVFLSSQWM